MRERPRRADRECSAGLVFASMRFFGRRILLVGFRGTMVVLVFDLFVWLGYHSVEVVCCLNFSPSVMGLLAMVGLRESANLSEIFI